MVEIQTEIWRVCVDALSHITFVFYDIAPGKLIKGDVIDYYIFPN